MSIFKCKMCGGTIEFEEGASIGTCDHCGTKQTLPKLGDNERANLYDRANHFRRNNEYDKAMGIYEKILNEDRTDAEAYWSLVLCKYGVEYVEDPATHKRVPTVNRTQFTSVFDDEDYKSAIQYADFYQKSIYEDEAKAINEIQKGILAISSQEEPFDIFICYKEMGNDGRRTPDSVLAQELYQELTKEGFKVFFSRITLEDKLGTAYEPYIFAALNSAKVMVVVGTKPEYFNAVWVKNEWSRYLALIKSGARKTLIPAYRDMDPYDLPEEFSHLQAQDMSKLGFMQDLVRGVKKLLSSGTSASKSTITSTAPSVSAGGELAPLLKRVFMFLEDGDVKSANEYCERVLDIDPENARAYLGKLMAECRACRMEDLQNCRQPFDGSGNYNKILRFAEPKLIETLKGYIAHINERNEHDRLERERKAEEERLEQERKAEEDRLERERKAEEERLEQERKYRTNIICSAIVIIFEIAFCIVFVGGGYFADLASIGSSPVPNLILAGIILSNSLISAVITRKSNLKFVVYVAPTISSIMAFVSYLLMWFGSRSNGIFAQIFEFIIYTIFFGGIALLISFLCFKLTWIINKEIK